MSVYTKHSQNPSSPFKKHIVTVRLDALFIPIIERMRLINANEKLIERLLSAFDEDELMVNEEYGNKTITTLKKRIKQLEHSTYLYYQRLAQEEKKMNELKARFNARSDKPHLRLRESYDSVNHICSDDCL